VFQVPMCTTQVYTCSSKFMGVPVTERLKDTKLKCQTVDSFRDVIIHLQMNNP